MMQGGPANTSKNTKAPVVIAHTAVCVVLRADGQRSHEDAAVVKRQPGEFCAQLCRGIALLFAPLSALVL